MKMLRWLRKRDDECDHDWQWLTAAKKNAHCSKCGRWLHIPGAASLGSVLTELSAPVGTEGALLPDWPTVEAMLYPNYPNPQNPTHMNGQRLFPENPPPPKGARTPTSRR